MNTMRPRLITRSNAWHVAIALSGLAVLTPLSGQSPAAPAKSDDVLVLPDIRVTGSPDLPPPESWNYTQFEGFEVLSNASERTTTRLLKDFRMFKQALSLAWPMPPHAPIASTLILCGRKDKFAGFVPEQKTSSEMGSASLFLRDLERAAIVIDLQTSELTLSGLQNIDGTQANGIEVDAYKQLYREYVHYLLNQGPGRMPAWQQEGIAQIVMAMEFTDRWVIFGKIDATRSQPAPAAADPAEDAPESDMGQNQVQDQPFNAALQRRRLMPLAELFAVQPDSPEARNPLGNNLWAKQSYAFVHLCLYGMNGRYKKAFEQFVERLGREPVSEGLFKACFQKNYAEMNQELRGYIDFTNHTYQTITLKGGERFGGPPPELRPATEGEIGRIKGDAMNLAGRAKEGLQAYRDAYLRGDRDPALLAALGVAEQATGQADRARPLLEAAAKTNIPRSSVYIELARLRLAEAKAKPAAPDGQLDEAQVNAVVGPLLTARKVAPPRLQTYDLIAETWSLSAFPPSQSQLTLLTEGIRNFPRESVLYYQLARFYLRAGNPTAAVTVAEVGLKLAANAEARARFEKLLAAMPPATPKH